MVNDQHNSNRYKIALFVALACVLQIAESLIPHPVPGLRLGLANILTVTALVMLGFRYALEITFLRTLLSSFIMGTFMSPGFMLSFTGAIISTIIMGILFRFSILRIRHGLSIIGISIAGAFAHNMIQLLLAYLLLIKHSGILIFFPWLSIGAVIMGYVIGLVSGGVCRNLTRLHEYDTQEDLPSLPQPQLIQQYVPGNSLLHRTPGHIKIMVVVGLSITVLIVDRFLIYFFLFGFLASAVLLSRTPVSFLFGKIKRYSSLILLSFLLPFFFNSGTHPIVTVAHFNITHEGLITGALLASRILFLILTSAMLIRTTSSEDMTCGLALLLSPLKYMGISARRTASIMSLSWNAVPVLWETTREAISSADLKKAKNYRNLIPLLSRLISRLYLEVEKGGRFWRGY